MTASTNACLCLGLCGFLKQLLALPYYFYIFYVRKFLFNSVLQKFAGKWAIVTGCTDGIGLEYALQLAKMGFNLVLIARNESKLNDVASAIAGKYNVDTKTVVIDFTDDIKIYTLIAEQIQGIDVAVLVNNVGMGYPFMGRLDELQDPSNFTTNLLRCNVESVTRMCQLIIPQFMQKRYGYIINVASYSGIINAPYLALYAASKSYMISLSQALQDEYSSYGLTIQCVAPLFISTKLSKLKPSVFAPTPKSFVESALSTLGLLQFTFGCMAHYLQHMLLSMLPRRIITFGLLKQKQMQAAILAKKQQRKTE